MKEILTLIVAVIMIIAFLAAFLKAGYSVAASLLMGLGLCVPFVNIAVLLFFLLSKWPIQQELGTLKKRFAPALDYPSEPTQCLSCGAMLPSGGTQCPACGWTYEQERR
jgi:ribosomal protein L40E